MVTYKTRKITKLLIFACMALIIAAGTFVIYAYFHFVHFTSDDVRKADIESFNAGDFEEVIISMLPPEYFDENDIGGFTGKSTAKASHMFTNMYDIKSFLDDMTVSPKNVYLVIDPVKISAEYGYHASLYARMYNSTLLAVMRSHPDTSYKVLLSYYSLDYWKSLSETEVDKTLSAYRDFLNIFYGEPNAVIYYVGAEEWLIANPENYEAPDVCNESVSNQIVALTLQDDSYILTPLNMEKQFDAVKSLVADLSTDELLADRNLAQKPDLSYMDIVFFGDSVIGNFTDSTSIPGVVAGLSGARTYNMGVGGATATCQYEDAPNAITTVEAFLSADSSFFSEGQQAKYGIEDYYADHETDSERDICFVINYGFNDYFGGMPIEEWKSDSTDMADGEYDTASYKGALKAAVMKLRSAFPECRIVLMTPGYCSYYRSGTIPKSSDGGMLEEYVNAVIDVADEMGVECIDNYHNLGINAFNHGRYLSDGCHPNTMGRYIMAWYIVDYLSTSRQ
jgi:hypothetical protein